GIPKQELPKLFERFHRVENTTGRSYEGTGIGLSLVKELVQLHEGTISLDSEEGKGSEFVVTIPIKNDTSKKPAPQKKERIATPLSQVFLQEATALADQQNGTNGTEVAIIEETKATILVVDDNADMRQHLK